MIKNLKYDDISEIRKMIDENIDYDIKIKREIEKTKSYQEVLFSKQGLSLLFEGLLKKCTIKIS